ncbi:MAG TPA: hypothetical protein VGH27_00885 [Streptosporangiaceae bacterium]
MQVSPAAASVRSQAAVTGASLQVSSLSAAATQVDYSVTFRSPAALTFQTSTITVTAPAGTKLSDASGCYVVSDDAAPPGRCGGTTITGLKAVISVPEDIAAGDPVTVILDGTTNAATTGAKTLKVATSADPTAVSLPFTLVAKQAVTGAALHVSSQSAGASGTAYTLTFTSPARLITNSLITVVFPAGTGMPVSGCSQTDWIDDTNGSGGCVTEATTGTTATVHGLQSNPGDVNTIVFYNVTSPAGAGSHSVKLSTTSDPQPVTLTYSLVAKTAVTNPFLQLSNYTAGASGADWAIGFTAPDRLVQSGAGSSSTQITIKAPAGTVFPAGGCSAYTFIDAGPAASQGAVNGCLAATVSGTTVTVENGFDTNPGNTIFLVIDGVKNPSSMSTIKVSTGADPTPVTIPLSAATVMAATDQLSSTSAGASEVTYAETFASTGPLTASTSTLTLTSPDATFAVCSAHVEYLEIDDTTGAQAGICPPGSTTPGPSVTLTDELNTSAGDEITVLAYGITNPAAAGSSTFAISTLPGAGGASLPIKITAKTAVSGVQLSLSSTSASAGVVALSATFTAPNGLMVSGLGDDFSTIVVKAAAGTKFLPTGYADVINDDTGASAGSTYTSSGTTATVIPGSGGSLGSGPGDEISVIIWGMTNPAAGGSVPASLSTTSDPKVVTAGYTLTAPASVSDNILQLSSTAGGATGVTYTQAFILANTLVTTTDSNSTITTTLPAGTGMPGGGSDNVNVIDETTGVDCGGNAAITGTTAVITLGTGSCVDPPAAGDVVALTLSGVTNAGGLSGKSVALSTSADPAVVSTPIP